MPRPKVKDKRDARVTVQMNSHEEAVFQVLWLEAIRKAGASRRVSPGEVFRELLMAHAEGREPYWRQS